MKKLKITTILVLILDFLVVLLFPSASQFFVSRAIHFDAETILLYTSAIFGIFLMMLLYSHAHNKNLRGRIGVWGIFIGIHAGILILYNFLIDNIYNYSGEGTGFLMLFSVRYFGIYIVLSLIVALLSKKLEKIRLARTVLPLALGISFIVFPVLGITEHFVRNLNNRTSDYFRIAFIIFPVVFVILTALKLIWAVHKNRTRIQV